jgi:hypothetical protein
MPGPARSRSNGKRRHHAIEAERSSRRPCVARVDFNVETEDVIRRGAARLGGPSRPVAAAVADGAYRARF